MTGVYSILNGQGNDLKTARRFILNEEFTKYTASKSKRTNRAAADR